MNGQVDNNNIKTDLIIFRALDLCKALLNMFPIEILILILSILSELIYKN